MKSNIVLFLFIVLGACSDNPTGPELARDPRQYTWDVDTLSFPGSLQTIMYEIWASSPTNIYVAGHNDRGRHMFHYDGETWNAHILPGNINDLHGFAADDIWAVGNETRSNHQEPSNPFHFPLILHYDGQSWQKVDYLREEGRWLMSFGGVLPDKLFAGGLNGILFRYNGRFWEPDSVPFEVDANTVPNHLIITIAGDPQSGEVYMVYRDGQGVFYFLNYKNDNWRIIQDMQNTPSYGFWFSPWGRLYAANRTDLVRWWDGSTWHPVTETGGEQTIGFSAQAVMGAAADNLFVVGHGGQDRIYGKVAHYNGSDWFVFEELQFPDVRYTDLWTDGREVFIVGHTLDFPQITLVLHGK